MKKFIEGKTRKENSRTLFIQTNLFKLSVFLSLQLLHKILKVGVFEKMDEKEGELKYEKLE